MIKRLRVVFKSLPLGIQRLILVGVIPVTFIIWMLTYFFWEITENYPKSYEMLEHPFNTIITGAIIYLCCVVVSLWVYEGFRTNKSEKL